jgi:hypothetical protein
MAGSRGVSAVGEEEGQVRRGLGELAGISGMEDWRNGGMEGWVEGGEEREGWTAGREEGLLDAKIGEAGGKHCDIAASIASPG